jgi:hypothetical protein
MRYRRVFALIGSLAMLVAARGGEDSTDTSDTTETTEQAPDTTEATEAPTTTGEPPETTSTDAGPDLSDHEFEPSHVCYFSAHHLFVSSGSGGAAVDALENIGIAAQEGFIRDVLAEEGLGGDLEETALEEYVDIVTFDGSENALLVAEFLSENVAPTTPVHAIGMAGHWQFKPGNEPVALSQEEALELLEIPDVAPEGDRGVAVVDTGIVEFQGYSWVLEGVDYGSTAGDAYEFTASHGTFIVSLIRQVAPDVNVTFARVPGPTDKAAYFQSWPEGELMSFDTNLLSHEIDAYQGIHDVIELHDSNVPLEALSLSWGTYPCDSPAGAAVNLEALDGTLERFDFAFREAEVFAAAGNEPPSHGPFIPAAHPNVTGVAIDVGDSSMALVWDDQTPIGAQLPWASILAEGCDMVGVGGYGDGPVVAWGGSSFATPLAAVGVSSGPSVNLGRCTPAP